MGLIEMARILFIPCYYYGLHLTYLETGEGIVGLSQVQFTWCVVLMVLSGLCLIVAGIDTIQKSRRLAEHLSRIEGKE